VDTDQIERQERTQHWLMRALLAQFGHQNATKIQGWLCKALTLDQCLRVPATYGVPRVANQILVIGRQSLVSEEPPCAEFQIEASHVPVYSQLRKSLSHTHAVVLCWCCSIALAVSGT
jgi:hypothetical protein